MFRQRKRGSRKFEAARQAKSAARFESPAPDYPVALPSLRRVITITDYDFGEVEHRIECRRSNRVDCYRITVDGQPIPGRHGWSAVLELARKAFVRVGSPARV